MRLVDGTPVELVVGDDVDRACAGDQLQPLRLEVKVADMSETEGITVQVNGVTVSPESIERVDASTFQIGLRAPPLRQGINRLVFLPGLRSSGRLTSQVTAAQLSVRYK